MVTEVGPKVAEDAVMIDVLGIARMLLVSPKSVRRWCESGLIPAPLRFGRILRWRHAEIHAWIDAGCPDRATWEARRISNQARRT